MKKYILALDQGTTSSRAIVFDAGGNICSVSRKEFKQYYPRPGWVEHDPEEIFSTQITTAREAVKKAGLEAKDIAGIGITNQRETIVLWDRKTGKPVHNAIVWQCRRTAEICRRLKKEGFEKDLHKKTGLVLDPYFSGTKIMWLLGNVPGLKQRAFNGEIACGTIDSWLCYRLTGHHFTDPSNASRTLLFNIIKGDWDQDLLDAMKIPRGMLPEVKPSSSEFGLTEQSLLGGEIPVAGIAGDQQAALFGQCCFTPGMAKNTYGTGCFALIHTGNKPVFSKNSLLTTVAWQIGDKIEYALEGSVFIAGAVVQWLRDELKIIKASSETQSIASSVPDTGGVVFVPAFVGLGAPYWDPDARGAVFGMTRGTGQAHIIRAALESISFQTADLFDAIQKDIQKKVVSLRVDGGASANDFLLQFTADILNIPIIRPRIKETTALGAAYLAGLATGVYPDRKAIEKNWREDKQFQPGLDPESRARALTHWKKAVEAVRTFSL
ncbi:MAG: glycerol kinase GlpK [Spirochaetales bacterium]|nr:glycerol kinase GlpK [Spirochaetales bacterium]